MKTAPSRRRTRRKRSRSTRRREKDREREVDQEESGTNIPGLGAGCDSEQPGHGASGAASHLATPPGTRGPPPGGASRGSQGEGRRASGQTTESREVLGSAGQGSDVSGDVPGAQPELTAWNQTHTARRSSCVGWGHAMMASRLETSGPRLATGGGWLPRNLALACSPKEARRHESTRWFRTASCSRALRGTGVQREEESEAPFERGSGIGNGSLRGLHGGCGSPGTAVPPERKGYREHARARDIITTNPCGPTPLDRSVKAYRHAVEAAAKKGASEVEPRDFP